MYNQAGAGGAFVGWQTIPGGVTTDVPVGAGEQGTTLVVFAKRTSTTKIAFNQAAKGGAFVGWQPSSARQGFATLSRGVPNAFSTSSPKPCWVGSGPGPPPRDRCAALRSADGARRHRRASSSARPRRTRPGASGASTAGSPPWAIPIANERHTSGHIGCRQEGHGFQTEGEDSERCEEWAHHRHHTGWIRHERQEAQGGVSDLSEDF